MSLGDLEQADISFMPAGRALESDRVPQSFGGERFLKRQKMSNWTPEVWRTSWGIIVGRARLNRFGGKKVVLISSLEIPDITDRPETLLFDWEDFEIAGGLDKLAETIAIRERFEAERDNLTTESSRKEVERVLGCSSRQANRVLNKLRGGTRVTFREQILSLLADGEKKAAEMIAAIEGNPKAIHHELVRLVKLGEIVKVRWGVYALPETPP